MTDKNVMAAFELRHLRHLVALHEHGTLAAAAEAIHLSQSALTKSIAALELELDSPLFDRGGRRLSPNALHKKVLARAMALLREADDLQREAMLFRDGHILQLRLGVGPAVAQGAAPEALTRFRELHPDIEVIVQVGATGELAPALVDGELHLLVSEREQHEVADADLVIEPLAKDPLAGAVRPGHPLLDRAAVTPADALAYPSAAATPPERIARFIAETLAPLLGGVPRPDITCDDYELLVSIAESSDVIVLGPVSVLQRFARTGRLCLLPVSYPSPPAEPAVMLSAGRPVPPAVRTLADLFLAAGARRSSVA